MPSTVWWTVLGDAMGCELIVVSGQISEILRLVEILQISVRRRYAVRDELGDRIQFAPCRSVLRGSAVAIL